MKTPIPVWLLAAPGFFLCACAGPEYPPVPEGFSPIAETREGGLYQVRSGGADAQPVLFLHGTPGDWEGFAWYLADPALQQRFSLRAVDRPGFGATGGAVIASLAGQATALAPLLDPAHPAILVGHSLGGPIALQLAADYPDRVRALLLIAASVAPHLEQPRWYNRLADLPALRWLIPRALRRANAEIMPLASELEALAPRLAEIRVPATVIQGLRDRLVAPASADYLEYRLSRAPLRILRLPQAGHFVLWDSPRLVADELLRLSAPR